MALPRANCNSIMDGITIMADSYSRTVRQLGYYDGLHLAFEGGDGYWDATVDLSEDRFDIVMEFLPEQMGPVFDLALLPSKATAVVDSGSIGELSVAVADFALVFGGLVASTAANGALASAGPWLAVAGGTAVLGHGGMVYRNVFEDKQQQNAILRAISPDYHIASKLGRSAEYRNELSRLHVENMGSYSRALLQYRCSDFF